MEVSEVSENETKAFYAGFEAAISELVIGMREFSEMPAAGVAAKTFREFADGIEKLPVDNILNKWIRRMNEDEPQSS